MNILHIIIAKVSTTVTAIFISLGLMQTPVIEAPIADPIEVVIDTQSTSTPVIVKKTKRSVAPPVTTAEVTAPVVATTTTVTSSVSEPIVTQTLPTNAVPQQPQVIVVQVQQPDPVVAPVVGSTQTQTMEKLYQVTKGFGEGEKIVLDGVNEQAVRDFAEGLNQQINWRKQAQSALFPALKEALKANDYNVIEK